MNDPRPRIPIEQLLTKHRAQLREWANGTPSDNGPSRRRRRHQTGRNQQFNIKATSETIERFYKLADKRRIALGELLEKGLDALEALEKAGQGGT